MEETKTMSRPTATMGAPGSAQAPATKTMGSTAGTRVHITLGTDLNGYILNEVIAENTGEAQLFICSKSNDNYVAKVYHRDKKPKQEILSIIRTMQSPYVIRVIADGEYAGRYYEILPYYKHGDLLQAAPLDTDFISKTVVHGLNEALNALHGKDIVHRDIKPNNLFFTDNRQEIVVGDFGISSVLTAGKSVRMTSGSRTPGYSAPETLSGFVSRESDYYSMGITLLHLTTGLDPFSGMNEAQVNMLTLTKKIDIPATVPPRIAHLIRGLTVKEPKDRWGYTEVRKWLNHENVEIREAVRHRSDVKPYIFDGREIFTLDDLALSFAQKWEEGKKHLYRGLARDHIKQFGQDLASKAMDCEEERDQDLGFFKLIYAIYPNAPLGWCGEMFVDPEKLGDAIMKKMPDVVPSYEALLKSGALLYFVENRCEDTVLAGVIRTLQELAKTDAQSAYYRLRYLLGKPADFRFDGRTFEYVDDLVEYLYEKRDSIESYSTKLLEDKSFFAWLSHQGFDQHIESWKKITY